jgi:hypothetical protein
LKSKQERRSSRTESKKSQYLEEEDTFPPSKPKSSDGFVTHEQEWPSLTQTKSNDMSLHGRPASARSEETSKQQADTSSRGKKSSETRKPRVTITRWFVMCCLETLTCRQLTGIYSPVY